MSSFNYDYLPSVQSSYGCSYSTLGAYNSGVSQKRYNNNTTARYILPTFGTPPGYKTGYCNMFNTDSCGGQNGGGCATDLSAIGYQNFKNAYNKACNGTCSSQYVSKLCQ
jgi:hypothetical protein